MISPELIEVITEIRAATDRLQKLLPPRFKNRIIERFGISESKPMPNLLTVAFVRIRSIFRFKA